MSDQELEEIEKACAEATPGPWLVEHEGYGGPEAVSCIASGCRAVFGGDGGEICNAADARFTTGARSWVPALVAEVRRLRAPRALQIGAEREVEREACAQLAEAMGDPVGQGLSGYDVATAIRARGTT